MRHGLLAGWHGAPASWVQIVFSGIGSAVLSGVVAAGVAWLTATLTHRRSQRLADRSVALNAAVDVTRETLLLADAFDLARDQLALRAAFAQWSRETAVHRAVLQTQALQRGLFNATDAASWFVGFSEVLDHLEASTASTTDPQTGEVRWASYAGARREAMAEAQLHLRHLLEYLELFRRGDEEGLRQLTALPVNKHVSTEPDVE